MSSDRAREIFGEEFSQSVYDAPTIGECLSYYESDLADLLAGMALRAPWFTRDELIAQAEAGIAKCKALIARGIFTYADELRERRCANEQ